MNILVIGSGPAGSEAALIAAKQGHTVTCFDPMLGGVCLNEGCIPTKALLEDSFHLAKALELDLDFSPSHYAPSLHAHKDRIVSELKAALEASFKLAKIQHVAKHVSFKDDHHLMDEDGKLYEGDLIVIATGSSASIPKLPMDHPESCLTSRDLLSTAYTCPQRFAIIGAGVIGCEMATFLRMQGHTVYLIDSAPTILSQAPKGLSQGLHRDLKQNGISIEVNASIKRIQSFEATYQIETGTQSIECDHVVVATGRNVNFSSLHLENTRLVLEAGRPLLNSNHQTSMPHIVVLGDASGGPQLAHAASSQARQWGEFLQSNTPFESILIPNVVYTPLQAAWVGLCDESQGKTIKTVLTSNAKQKILLGTRGTITWYVQDTHLIGAEILSADAVELIGLCTNWIQQKTDLRTLHSLCLAHPSLSEAFLPLIEQIYNPS